MPIRAIKKEKGRGYLTPFSIPMIYEKLHCKGEPYHSIQIDLRNRHTQRQTTFLLLLYKEKWQLGKGIILQMKGGIQIQY